MRYEAYTGRATAQRAECIVLGVFEGGVPGAAATAADRVARSAISTLLKRGDFSGRAGETLLIEVRGLRARSALLVGQGGKAQFNRRAWRRSLTAACQALGRTRIASAVFALDSPAPAELDSEHLARATAEIVGAAFYRVNDRKSGKRPRPYALNLVRVGPFTAASVAGAKRALADGAALADSAALLRNLGNLPGNLCTPRHLADTAVALGRGQRKLRVKVLGEAQIRRLKMGSFLSVTRGSSQPPRFIIMDYRGGRRGAAPVVLVGKGITFDTGGISLKDPGGMDEMKFDMCGAATVIAALKFAVERALPINLVGLVPACENMPSGAATKPGDIVTSAAGFTIEVLNTDAEGRLILCDALHYARRYEPAAVIDMATLTGACVIALGHHHSGLISNDNALAGELLAAGVAADDRAWQLPLTDDYADQLRSNFADFANVGGRDAGAITAGAFLSKFTKGLRWAHLDIAGTAWATGAAKGASARPLPLIAEFLLKRARG
jgi:leucyl aminopeptidase